MFNGHWVREAHEKEPGGRPSVTEQAYVRPNDQIMNLMRAGRRLMAWRIAENELEKEPDVNPTLVRGVDFADVYAMASVVKRKLKDTLEHRKQLQDEMAAEAAKIKAEKEKAQPVVK